MSLFRSFALALVGCAVALFLGLVVVSSKSFFFYESVSSKFSFHPYVNGRNRTSYVVWTSNLR